jgi:glycyl-tRNA synthetase beta chain
MGRKLMAELLLEILSEEIPARMQARAAEDLKRLVCDGLKSAGIGFETARAYVTPRRLALVVDGIPAVRDDVSEEKRGPRVGAPDQAVQGFLKGAGLASLDRSREARHRQGRVLVRRRHQEGRADRRGPACSAIDAALKALPWPKSMKWGSGTMQWVRPLQSIVALFDGKVLKGEVTPGGADGAGRLRRPRRVAIAS